MSIVSIDYTRQGKSSVLNAIDVIEKLILRKKKDT